jgi:hypothetical protein
VEAQDQEEVHALWMRRLPLNLAQQTYEMFMDFKMPDMGNNLKNHRWLGLAQIRKKRRKDIGFPFFLRFSSCGGHVG